ncbi:hypothetical protein AMATHDRAFT_9549 [Amanita thiersii Skay4041]|uniref:Rab-GAP TBC domain-containing protein n=1 Tax=Amanita thiersii Skay4041 TaxID=703135 RepID=A0A2A9N8E0_9AGAR|nr:hypothetical protein AMATHDRAFT_9549 [Amanita thiersii Skay4041]
MQVMNTDNDATIEAQEVLVEAPTDSQVAPKLRKREDVDWATLRARSLQPGGFGKDREAIWPKLLNVRLPRAGTKTVSPPPPMVLEGDDGEIKQETDASAAAREGSTNNSIIQHRDERQIKLDTDRSFVLYPSEETGPAPRETLQFDLNSLIVSVFRNRPKLNYFQGYHDIMTVLYLTLPPEIQPTCAEKLSLHRLRDSMLTSLEPVVGLLRILKNLLRLADPEYAKLLERDSPLPFYALPNLLTLFSHDMPTLPLIQHVFDYLLCRPPITVVYLSAAILLAKKDYILTVEDHLDSFMLHPILSTLPPISEGIDPDPEPDSQNVKPPPAADISHSQPTNVTPATDHDPSDDLPPPPPHDNTNNTLPSPPPSQLLPELNPETPPLAKDIPSLSLLLPQSPPSPPLSSFPSLPPTPTPSVDPSIDTHTPTSDEASIEGTPNSNSNPNSNPTPPSLPPPLPPNNDANNDAPSLPPSRAHPSPSLSSSSLSPYPTPPQSPPNPIPLPTLLTQSDALLSRFPPTHPDLKVNIIMGPQSIVHTWSDNFRDWPTDDEAENMVCRLDLVVYPVVEEEEEDTDAEWGGSESEEEEEGADVSGGDEWDEKEGGFNLWSNLRRRKSSTTQKQEKGSSGRTNKRKHTKRRRRRPRGDSNANGGFKKLGKFLTALNELTRPTTNNNNNNNNNNRHRRQSRFFHFPSMRPHLHRNDRTTMPTTTTTMVAGAVLVLGVAMAVYGVKSREGVIEFGASAGASFVLGGGAGSIVGGSGGVEAYFEEVRKVAKEVVGLGARLLHIHI